MSHAESMTASLQIAILLICNTFAAFYSYRPISMACSLHLLLHDASVTRLPALLAARQFAQAYVQKINSPDYFLTRATSFLHFRKATQPLLHCTLTILDHSTLTQGITCLQDQYGPLL